MGNTLKSGKLLTCVIVAAATPWAVFGEDDHGHADTHAEASEQSKHDPDPEPADHADDHGENPADIEHLSELIDSRMPESGEKLRLSVSADHPITTETHGYEERTFIDVSLPSSTRSVVHANLNETTDSHGHGSDNEPHEIPEQVSELAEAEVLNHGHEVTGHPVEAGHDSFSNAAHHSESQHELPEDHEQSHRVPVYDEHALADTHPATIAHESHDEVEHDVHSHVITEALPHHENSERVLGHDEDDHPITRESHDSIHDVSHGFNTHPPAAVVMHEPDLHDSSDSAHNAVGSHYVADSEEDHGVSHAMNHQPIFNSHETHHEQPVMDSHHDSHVEQSEPSHGSGHRDDAHGSPSHDSHGVAHDARQLPFPHDAEASYAELSEQLHDRTFDLIKAEIRGDADLIQASIYAMTQSLQAIIDRASHPASPQPSHTIDSAARGMAIHLDRIDFALSQENMRKVSLLVGKVAAKVKELEGMMEAGGSSDHGSDHATGSSEHHDAHGANGHDSHAGLLH